MYLYSYSYLHLYFHVELYFTLYMYISPDAPNISPSRLWFPRLPRLPPRYLRFRPIAPADFYTSQNDPIGPSAANEAKVQRCASTRWILPVLFFWGCKFLMWQWVDSQAERGARCWCQDIPVISKLRRQQSKTTLRISEELN